VPGEPARLRRVRSPDGGGGAGAEAGRGLGRVVAGGLGSRGLWGLGSEGPLDWARRGCAKREPAADLIW
jgi:hypothetical protein